MRDILFKAKRIDNGEWVEGAYFPKTKYPTKKNRTFIWVWQIGKIYCDYNCGYSPYEVDEKTICQYTGLKDKNGNKIWENDIIKPYDTVTNENYIIGWDKEMGAFVFCDINTNNSLYVLVGHYIESIQSVEVIGNIFDNPELLNHVDNEASQQAHQEVLKSAT